MTYALSAISIGAFIIGWMLASWRAAVRRRDELTDECARQFQLGRRAGFLEGRLDRSAAPFTTYPRDAA